MRYHYERPQIYRSAYRSTYECNHPVYDRCPLLKIDTKGLSVIQQRYNSDKKHTYWTEIDPWLTYMLYLNPKFKKYFDERSGESNNGIYPTVTIRQIMWALKIKPIPKE